MADLIWVALGGAVGSLARYGVSVALAARLGLAFPWGTLAVNLAGSFFLGLVMGWSQATITPTAVRLALGTGLLGAFTTFSTLQWETLALLRTQQWKAAALYVTASLLAGLVLVALGFAAGQHAPGVLHITGSNEPH